MSNITHRTYRVGAYLVATLAAASAAFVAAPSASAATSPVLGSAYGYKASVSIFGGAPMVKSARPSVKLPTAGSATPVTKSAASGLVMFGPATLFSSTAISVSTVGTSGNASSMAAVQTVGDSPFTATSITSTCTAANGGAASGGVSVTGGEVVTSTDAMGNPATMVPVPTNPGANLSIAGSLVLSPTDTETFTWIFNQQTHNANGSLTVNAAKEVLHGPTAKGSVIIGESLCRA